jgi:hypothetical protein
VDQLALVDRERALSDDYKRILRHFGNPAEQTREPLRASQVFEFRLLEGLLPTQVPKCRFESLMIRPR